MFSTNVRRLYARAWALEIGFEPKQKSTYNGTRRIEQNVATSETRYAATLADDVVIFRTSVNDILT